MQERCEFEQVFETRSERQTGMNYEAMYEISTRLSDESLAVLAQTSLWPLVARASQDEVWWFRRLEFLLLELGVNHSLERRDGCWSSVYSEIAKHGLNLNKYDASNLLLIQVGLQIADPTPRKRLVNNAAWAGNLSVIALLLFDQRVDVTGANESPLVDALYNGNIDCFKLLVADRRVNPCCWNHIDPFILAVENNEVECVRLLLQDDRRDPAIGKPVNIAAKYGYVEMYTLLLSDARILAHISRLISTGYLGEYGLKQAVLGSHTAIVKLALKYGHQDITGALHLACKGSSYETIELLFRDSRCEPSSYCNNALRVARNGKRADVIALLLTDEKVRALDRQR